jgi:hypothetical protein
VARIVDQEAILLAKLGVTVYGFEDSAPGGLIVEQESDILEAVRGPEHGSDGDGVGSGAPKVGPESVLADADD